MVNAGPIGAALTLVDGENIFHQRSFFRHLGITTDTGADIGKGPGFNGTQ